MIEFLWQFRWLFDDLLLDSRRKGKQKTKKQFCKKNKKERGLCVCTKFSTVLGVVVVVGRDFFVSRRDPCSKEFETQLK